MVFRVRMKTKVLIMKVLVKDDPSMLFLLGQSLVFAETVCVCT